MPEDVTLFAKVPDRGTPLGRRPLEAAEIGARGYRGPAGIVYAASGGSVGRPRTLDERCEVGRRGDSTALFAPFAAIPQEGMGQSRVPARDIRAQPASSSAVVVRRSARVVSSVALSGLTAS